MRPVSAVSEWPAPRPEAGADGWNGLPYRHRPAPDGAHLDAVVTGDLEPFRCPKQCHLSSTMQLKDLFIGHTPAT
ncbi:hypothetical protein GCM10027562_02280 [Arthrobacter pigmenti]